LYFLGKWPVVDINQQGIMRARLWTARLSSAILYIPQIEKGLQVHAGMSSQLHKINAISFLSDSQRQ
jgi:hypothetical protein